MQVANMYAGAVGSDPVYMKQIGSTVFFGAHAYSGTGYDVGNELYGLDPATLPVHVSSFRIE